MTHLHRLDLDQPGTFAGARVVCLGNDGDLCRQWCMEGCEEGCWHTPIPADTEQVAQAPVNGHRWGPFGSCRIAEWINAVGVEDTFAADDWPPNLPEPRSGFIEEEWTGGDYVWTYAADAPSVEQPIARVAGQLAIDAEVVR